MVCVCVCVHASFLYVIAIARCLHRCMHPFVCDRNRTHPQELNQLTPDGQRPPLWTALHCLAQKREQRGALPEAILSLVQSGASVNALNGNGATPLLTAAGCSHTQAVAALLEMQADVEAPMGEDMMCRHQDYWAHIACAHRAARAHRASIALGYMGEEKIRRGIRLRAFRVSIDD